MLDGFENGRIPVGLASFEVLLPWEDEWMSIVVVRLRNTDEGQHFIVQFPESRLKVLRQDESGEWDELHGGRSRLASKLGEAIENYYAICN